MESIDFWFVLMYSTCFHSLDDKRVLIQLLFQLCNLQMSANSSRKMPRSCFTQTIWWSDLGAQTKHWKITNHFRTWHNTCLSKHVCACARVFVIQWYTCIHIYISIYLHLRIHLYSSMSHTQHLNMLVHIVLHAQTQRYIHVYAYSLCMHSRSDLIPGHMICLAYIACGFIYSLPALLIITEHSFSICW